MDGWIKRRIERWMVGRKKGRKEGRKKGRKEGNKERKQIGGWRIKRTNKKQTKGTKN